MVTTYSEEEILSIIGNNRQSENYEREKYKEEQGELFFQFESIEDILRDFDEWKEQYDLEVDKIIDANFWSAL
ncbi:MAG: hypothetical protein EZS26_000993 [Candidatus Ordinivivax streblomastigis]|uniref:Uncharacterized protein n=1 Tax=Candidatus Ordinivivax streblomastigis TaxID=2540710 RepID=A0A5M8P2Z3_9BACT|nr:MAG: hypothetical protein EZS26_000993 [Candidatus Ordinivivax streblomastigis]